MFEGTRVKLQILSPTIDHPITKPVRATISDTAAEFDDPRFTQIAGDPDDIVAAKYDIDGSRVTLTVIETDSARFDNVDDRTGFNGAALTFEALTGNEHMSIRDARIVTSATSFGLGAKNVAFDDDTLFLNVDNLPFEFRDRATIELGFDIAGTGASERLVGGDGRDLISGGKGADSILGNSGDDQLVGGRGADHLMGGHGADRFIFNAVSDSTAASSGRDTIHDFTHGLDRINLAEIDARHGTHGNQAFKFIANRGFSETAGELRSVLNSGDTYVQGDTDGDGRADFSIMLEDPHRLVSSDFLL